MAWTLYLTGLLEMNDYAWDFEGLEDVASMMDEFGYTAPEDYASSKPEPLAPKLIAGHRFIERMSGRVCESCGRKWVDIAWATREHVGWPDIAHVGNLNEREADEIQAEVLDSWKRGKA